MKSRLKLKIGSVAGEMGRGQHYVGNAAGQIIKHQPVVNVQYESLVEESACGHSSTQQTIINNQNQIQHQAMVMQQIKQQLEMNAAQPWQKQQQQPTQKYHNNNNNINRGRRIRDKNNNNNNNNNNRNGGGNQPTWSSNNSNNGNTNTKSIKFYRKNIPNNIRSNETPKYFWMHGHGTRHNINKCTAQCVGNKNNATTHVNTGGNPKNAERVLTTSAVGITGIDVRTCGKIQQHPSWKQQSNMGYCIPTQQPMMMQQPTMYPMMHQPMMQQ